MNLPILAAACLGIHNSFGSHLGTAASNTHYRMPARVDRGGDKGGQFGSRRAQTLPGRFSMHGHKMRYRFDSARAVCHRYASQP